MHRRLWIRLRASHGRQKAGHASRVTVGYGETYLNKIAHGGQRWDASYLSREHVRDLSRWLLLSLSPDIAEAIDSESARTGLRLSEDEELIYFYSRALVLLLWVRDGHSVMNHHTMDQMVSDNAKQYIHFRMLIDAYQSLIGMTRCGAPRVLTRTLVRR